jgi:hypothetical protein
VKTIEEFVHELESLLPQYLPPHTRQVFLHTAQSYKTHFHIRPDFLLAVRYNATNGRTDVALILQQQRVFGFDNLKEWHFHPFENPLSHIPCDEPTLEFILRETSTIINRIITL